MSRERDNAMWRRIEDVFHPSAEDLAWTDSEIELRHDQSAEAPLLPAESVLNAAKSDPFGAEQQARAKRRRARQHLSAAATFLLASASLAWVSSNYVWPRHAPRIWSTETSEANAAVTSADSELSDWQRALGYFSGRHTTCLRTMVKLANAEADGTSVPADIRAAASAAIGRYLDEGDAPECTWSSSVEDAATTALDPQAETAVRCEAIRYLEQFLRHAEASIASASAETEQRATIRSAYLRGLQTKRSRLRSSERQEG